VRRLSQEAPTSPVTCRDQLNGPKEFTLGGACRFSLMVSFNHSSGEVLP
jgi:hypothetical protein